MQNNIKKGIILALVTAFISGFSIFYNKLVITKGIDPLIFNLIKNGGVGLILSALLITSRRLPKLTKLPLYQWKKLIVIAFVGGSIPFLLFFEGLRTVSATNANLLHKTLFIWVAAMAIPVLGERLNIWQIVGYWLVAWSNLFMGGFSGFSGSVGELMILGATLLWSLENVIAKITLKDIDSNIVAWGRMFIGSLILLAIAVSQDKLILFTRLTLEQFLQVAPSIVFLTGYVVTWYKALKFAPATVVASVLILATPITNLLSTVFITHNLPQPQFINLIFTVVGIALISLISRLPKRRFISPV